MKATAVDPDRRRRFEGCVVPEIAFLVRVCRSMSASEAEAEDLAQDVLLRSYRAIDGFDGSHPRAWLYRIARNCAINRTRRRGRVEFVADPDGSALQAARAAGWGAGGRGPRAGFRCRLGAGPW